MYLSYYKESPYRPKSQNVRGVTIRTLASPATENKYYVTRHNTSKEKEMQELFNEAIFK